MKRFLGTSENAVKSQLRAAIAVYALMAILRKQLGLQTSLHAMIRKLSLKPFHRQDLRQLLADAYPEPPTAPSPAQLPLFDDLTAYLRP